MNPDDAQPPASRPPSPSADDTDTAEDAPGDPVRDPARLREIVDLDLVAQRIDPELQALVAEASATLDLPMALVSIVLDDAQYFAAMHGVEGWIRETRGTPVEWSFCAHIVRSGEPFVVENAAEHPLTRHIPLVREENLQSYAGVPLRTSQNQIVGSLCVLGDASRQFDDNDLENLSRLARRVLAALEARRRHGAA